jgi:hypothetical protein
VPDIVALKLKLIEYNNTKKYFILIKKASDKIGGFY